CVADATGALVFVSPALGWALGQDAAVLAGRPYTGILDILADKLPVTESGFYEVALLRQHRDPLVMGARIDIVDLGEGQKYTVIWLDPDNSLQKQKQSDFGAVAREFAAFINENRNKDAAADERDGK